MIRSLGKLDNPASALAEAKDGAVSFSFEHTQYYLDDEPTLLLHAITWQHLSHQFIAITTDEDDFDDALERAIDDQDARAAARVLDVIDITMPLPLETVTIAKPWGAEIWYTGIEKRGVCTVQHTPLPWLIDAMGASSLGEARAPLLLKILDPLPDAVYGDLYFEMHDKKTEVYVVTNIDKNAWPEGTGAIRFGFDVGDDRAAFEAAYLATAEEYQSVRRQIDKHFDDAREAAGIALAEVVLPAQVEAWKANVPSALDEREQALREKLDGFSVLQPIGVGDVVQVPPFTPHSLQHGVRVVEFQTPHYERYILSFAQKVLTQDHWDTREALARVNWDASFEPDIQMVDESADCLVERVADFEDFEVLRVRLQADAQFELALPTYAIVMTVSGGCEVSAIMLEAEQACLLPASLGNATLYAALPSLVLIARPR